jgi:hypothetical protein
VTYGNLSIDGDWVMQRFKNFPPTLLETGNAVAHSLIVVNEIKIISVIF